MVNFGAAGLPPMASAEAAASDNAASALFPGKGRCVTLTLELLILPKLAEVMFLNDNGALA